MEAAAAKPETTVTKSEAKVEQPNTTTEEKSFMQIIPWTGLASLGAMILCAIASAVVVGVANGRFADSWSIQPPVILAIIAAVSNIAFNSAMATGIAVRFWLYASRDANLSQLHYIWDHGRGFGFLSALRAGSEARTVAILATIAYVTQFASGPLVQRSVDQSVIQYESTQTLYMDVATSIPDGWFGHLENDNVVGFMNGIPQQQAIQRNFTMHTRLDPTQPEYVCNGTCYGYVQGAGFAHRCSTTQYTLAMATTATDEELVFTINSTRLTNSKGDPYLELKTLYVSDVNASCIGTVVVTTCQIDAGVVEYPVTVSNTAISLRTDELTKMHVVSTYVNPLDLPGQKDQAPSGPLAALRALTGSYGDPLWTETYKTYQEKIERTRYQGPDTNLADMFIRMQTPHFENDDGPTRKCALTWADPTTYVLNYMHEFMFRSALRLGMNGTSLIGQPPPQGEVSPDRKTFEARRVTPVSVFVIDPGYLGAGIVAMVLALTLVTCLMWGWWRLRRSVTLSPLETVTALVDAQELRQLPPDTTLKQILSKVETVTTTCSGVASPSGSASMRSGLGGPSAPFGYGLRKTLTSRSGTFRESSTSLIGQAQGGNQPRPGGLKKASTFSGTEMGTAGSGGQGPGRWQTTSRRMSSRPEIEPVGESRNSG
ncbi:hypothetical protein V8F33_007981 [Rhypophila sp. PSN 637]